MNWLDPIARYLRQAVERHERRDHMDLWTGEMMTVNTVNGTCTVNLRGETTATTCHYLRNVTPAVGFNYFVLVRNRSYLVLNEAIELVGGVG